MKKLLYVAAGAWAGWWAWGKLKQVKEVKQMQLAANMQGAMSAATEALVAAGINGTVEPATMGNSPVIVINVDDPMAVTGVIPPVINGLPVVII